MENLTCDTGEGDIRLDLGETDGMEVEASSEDGQVRIHWPGGYYVDAGGEKRIYGNGACKIQAHTDCGDIEIKAVALSREDRAE